LIKSADWLIDLGPEAGADGGQLLWNGTPEMVVQYAQRAASRLEQSTQLGREALAPV
jgi:excinuclease ABC subunit A